MSRMSGVHICSFSAVEELRGRKLTYDALKAAVLKAGRFSAFEATTTQRHAKLYTQLCRDPEIETLHDAAGFGYPWTGVRRREVPLAKPTPRKQLTNADLVLRGGDMPADAPVQAIAPEYPGAPELCTTHFAWRFNQRGGVSSLCAPSRVIKVASHSSWALVWVNVSCVKCRAKALAILETETPSGDRGV